MLRNRVTYNHNFSSYFSTSILIGSFVWQHISFGKLVDINSFLVTDISLLDIFFLNSGVNMLSHHLIN